jgi:hypothetical protein
MVLRIDAKSEKSAPKVKAATRGGAKLPAARAIKSLWKKAGKPTSLKQFARSHEDGRNAASSKQWLANKSS